MEMDALTLTLDIDRAPIAQCWALEALQDWPQSGNFGARRIRPKVADCGRSLRRRTLLGLADEYWTLYVRVILGQRFDVNGGQGLNRTADTRISSRFQDNLSGWKSFQNYAALSNICRDTAI
jgi:hypothetical protein